MRWMNYLLPLNTHYLFPLISFTLMFIIRYGDVMGEPNKPCLQMGRDFGWIVWGIF